ncbi:MAG: hypothetical protein NC394_05325 [Bacteroides sp.]|nr:hypothetical protein [Bacteroides sp.]
MEWKKSSISQSELEKQQQAYIKEALEMAKKSVISQFEKKDEVEKAERERLAAEKAEAERIAAEKAEAERIAAQKAESERLAAEKAEAERLAAEKAEAERLAAEKAKAERLAAEKLKEELTVYHNAEETEEAAEASDSPAAVCPESCEEKDRCEIPSAEEEREHKDDEEDIIDMCELKNLSEKEREANYRVQSRNPVQPQVQTNPPNFNRYINDHNKNQCNCPNCRRKRAEQQH